MKNLLPIFFTSVCLLLLSACQQQNNKDYKVKIQNPEYLHRVVKKLTDIIVHDIFSPPVASRNYVYPCVAAYEAALPGNPTYMTIAGQLKGLKPLPQPEKNKEYCFPLAAFAAFTTSGKKFIFSEDEMQSFEEEFLKELKSLKIPKDVFERSIAYGKTVAKHINDWADQDNYRQTRTYPRYTVLEKVSAWKPTPPAYMEGIEPNWNKIRPFLLDSASQFAPPPPTKFDMEKGSPFYQEVLEVYETGSKLSDGQKAIAAYWDCNPFVANIKGHAMFASKKISPGGHWMSIVKFVSRQAKLDFGATLEAYVRVALGLADGFISCWDEKWRSILIRPETVINQFIDEDWTPFLQTPPFPEYTSGHSVISNASAEILTDLLGDNFAFSDSTEVEYGLGTRSFKSFREAASEAAISRLYGGIHFMPAIKNGSEQGKRVGNWVVRKLKTRKEK